MTKIVKVDEIKSTWQGKEKKSYKFHLDDGKEGFTANQSPWEFKEGENVSYTTEVKKSSKGEYNLFTFTRLEKSAPDNTASSSPPTPPVSPPQHGKSVAIPSKSIEEQKVEAAISATEFITSMFNAERIKWEDFVDKQRECVKLLWTEIDEIYGRI